MFTVTMFLLVAAFVCCIASAMNKCPGWVPVLLLCVLELVRALPVH